MTTKELTQESVNDMVKQIETMLAPDYHNAYIQEYASGKYGVIIDGYQHYLAADLDSVEVWLSAFICALEISNGKEF